ncbi:MAG: hypothetical protein IPM97_13560 [Bdellovibrionaceae bacterium]|nr:hypothetical protein [Pseudobdellovibrionaceae bacterium]
MTKRHLGLKALVGMTFALVLSWVPQVKADIIFINLNGSATEIPAIQSVAAQMGERVYILPQKGPGEYTSQYETIQLTTELVELAKQGVRPRALVVSGHHSKNEGFWGTNGEASLYYIGKILPKQGEEGYQEAREFFASLQSVYLWGCYTGQLGHVYRLLNGENAAFPNTKYVVGFGEKGPLNTDPLSGRMLKDVLLKESQLRNGTTEQTYTLLKTIPSYQQRDLLIHKGTTFVSKIGAMTQEQFIRSCADSSRKEVLKNSIQLIWDYYWNRIGPIPENTSKSELREAYENLQRNSYCIKMGAVDLSKHFGEVPSPSNVIRLIFYKNIIRNFSRLYAEHLSYTEKELAAHGISNLGFLTEIDQTDRGEVMSKIQEAHRQIADKYKSKTNPEARAKFLYLNGILDDIEEVVYPNGQYVPLRWIDPVSNEFTDFSFFSQFEKALETAKKEAGLVTK